MIGIGIVLLAIAIMLHSPVGQALMLWAVEIGMWLGLAGSGLLFLMITSRLIFGGGTPVTEQFYESGSALISAAIIGLVLAWFRANKPRFQAKINWEK